jgi:hypothetical protein
MSCATAHRASAASASCTRCTPPNIRAVDERAAADAAAALAPAVLLVRDALEQDAATSKLACAVMTEISDYEKKRLETIASNRDIMIQLGLAPDSSTVVGISICMFKNDVENLIHIFMNVSFSAKNFSSLNVSSQTSTCQE